MTLLDRIEYFILASMTQDDPGGPDEVVNLMTPHELLSAISDALEHAGVTFNKDF
jgi:hypothetical protein